MVLTAMNVINITPWVEWYLINQSYAKVHRQTSLASHCGATNKMFKDLSSKLAVTKQSPPTKQQTKSVLVTTGVTQL